MRKLIGGAAAAAALVVLVFSTARADEHLTPGTPNTPSCRGQTTAFLAQSAKEGHAGEALNQMGIGGVAHSSNLSVKDIHDIVEAFCSPPLPTP
jgi:hypothetical protein